MEFNINDRVECPGETHRGPGTIIGITKQNNYFVGFDSWDGGHNGGNSDSLLYSGKLLPKGSKNGLFCESHDLNYVNTPKFKEGDLVITNALGIEKGRIKGWKGVAIGQSNKEGTFMVKDYNNPNLGTYRLDEKYFDLYDPEKINKDLLEQAKERFPIGFKGISTSGNKFIVDENAIYVKDIWDGGVVIKIYTCGFTPIVYEKGEWANNALTTMEDVSNYKQSKTNEDGKRKNTESACKVQGADLKIQRGNSIRRVGL